jgi:tRNA-dihydrouridine synthase A
MLDPAQVATCVAAMVDAAAIPVTVKCRIGVDDQDPEDSLFRLVELSAQAGVKLFVVHARKALLQGLSPKENRDVPPLNYPLVWRLKRERPDLAIVINGGIGSLDEAVEHLAHVDGVMLGRAAYHTPDILGQADARIFGEGGGVGAVEAVQAYREYMASELAKGVHLAAMTRHMLGLFHGVPGARTWRRILTVEGVKPGAGLEVIDQALSVISGLEAQGVARRLEAGEAA